MNRLLHDRQSMHAFLGGALTSLYNAVQAEDLVKTCVLAATGAAVSFLVTWLLKLLTARITRKKKSR